MEDKVIEDEAEELWEVEVIKEGGFMFGSLQKVGAKFTLEHNRHFSKKWMKKITDVKIEESEKEPDTKEPSSMKVDELRTALEEKGIPVPDEAKKADLVELLEAA